ncbi:MAG: hypothetical protein CL801_08370 [Citromicrobium sp.]|nr:hypothetical protein [Citromicrobium sp.]|tara:strand:+ start:111578 stop:116374 length:4797 start_codon:yes stop_codon:yes gene_type:complete
MRDPWAEFETVEPDDPWAEFEEVKPDKKRPKRKRRDTPTISEGDTLSNPQATDGDTIRAQQGPVRLVGVDAPELAQQGWDAQGQPVPIGEQSQAFLADSLTRGASVVGPSFGQSFGRTVAPVELGGEDAGRMILQAGQGFAAPEYLADDPQRRAEYVQDDRLSRMNRQGVHGVVTQAPKEYRADPDYVPNARTVAQFADMPTPLAGLPADQESIYVQMLRDAPAEDILAFAEKQGLSMDEGYLRDWVEWRDKEAAEGREINPYAVYERAPRPLIDSGDGAVGAALRGAGSGFMLSGLDEAGAFLDAVGSTPGRENIFNSERRFADIWYNNQQQNAAILGYDQENHPVASTSGEVAGAIGSGFVLPYSAGARTVGQLARVGAAYGGVDGFLRSEGTVAQRLGGVPLGAGVGAIADPALGKLVEATAPLAARTGRALLNRNARVAGEAQTEARTAAEFADLPEGSEAPPAPRSVAMAVEGGEALSVPLPRPQAMSAPRSKAELLASASSLQPQDVLPIPRNFIDGPEEAADIDAGRIAEAVAPNERTALQRRSITNWRGESVPKVGPLDMVGFIRAQGGLRDEAGELSAMGLDNSARRGLDFVGQEARFGPLVSDEGMTLDDAALYAWEAGYFPEHTDRPDINTFLEALDETHRGGAGRRFLPDDQAEIEAYGALQSERYDLEQQRFNDGGPVFQDRSVPAGEDAPFAPPEAYAEWPSELSDRAGNIDLSKLESPQDISRALRQTEMRAGGFDAATRGRITQAETESLASELGMTPDTLLKRRKGQAFNAEEALAARQILAKSGNELVNAARKISRLDDPGDELLAEFRQKWMRHVAIQEQVAGMTAEAGRALQQFRQGARSGAVRGDVLSALVRSGGGKGELKDAADTLLEAVDLGQGKFNALAAKATKPKWRTKISELYINMLLSNPPTHAVNMVSNTLTSIAQIPEYATAAAIGGARRAIMGEKASERILASEVGARTFGLVQGTKEGVSLFAKALRTGDADDFVTKVEGDEYKAISGLKGEVIRVPTRLLTAEDQLFKGVARRMELNAQALRIANREGLKGAARAKRAAELSANPTDEMTERAFEYARYLTFQQKLGEFGQGISQITGNSLAAKVVVPFVRTPINLLKFATERSPAAPLLREWRKEFAAGGERRDLAVAKMLLGSGFAAIMYQAALEGKITGAAPPDASKARMLYADGWQPYSVKVGDTWVSYSRLDPFSTTLGVAADMATLPENLSDAQQDDQATMLVASIMGNLASKTWLSGVSSLVEGLSDPGRYAGNWVQRTVGAFTVPAGVAGVARAMDPVLRKRESVGDAIKSRIPGMSDQLYPRRDVFGEPVELGNWGPDFLSPFWSSQQKDDPVIAEMLRIGKSVSAPGKQYTEDGERIDYTPEEYDRYHEIAGRLTYNRLLGLMGSTRYSRMSDANRRKAAKKAIRDARKDARSVLSDPDYPLPAKGDLSAGAPAGAAVEWSEFEEAAPRQETAPVADGWEGFEEVEQRDVVGSLQSTIPGVRITSGFRTPEYQADMRRRGYRPAANSRHLDGSALDLTPPPGRSMQWLAAQVRRVEPEASILNEGDHLHVVFPDWHGAPLLGGMAA